MSRFGGLLGRRTLLATLAAALLAGTASLCLAQAAAGALDGQMFAGEFGKPGKKAEGKDELIFREGRFRSTACDPYKFGDAPYTTTADGDATRFEAETESPKYGRMKWTCRVQGDVLDGTFVWTKKNGKTVEYWIKANRKP